MASKKDYENYSVTMPRLTHVPSKTEIDLKIDFETELLMIENPNHEDFLLLDRYCCHLMSQAEFSEEKTICFG